MDCPPQLLSALSALGPPGAAGDEGAGPEVAEAGPPGQPQQGQQGQQGLGQQGLPLSQLVLATYPSFGDKLSLPEAVSRDVAAAERGRRRAAHAVLHIWMQTPLGPAQVGGGWRGIWRGESRESRPWVRERRPRRRARFHGQLVELAGGRVGRRAGRQAGGRLWGLSNPPPPCTVLSDTAGRRQLHSTCTARAQRTRARSCPPPGGPGPCCAAGGP